jgi:hypothetical protein
MAWPLAVLASEPGRSFWGGQRLEHPSANRLDSVERFGDLAEQHFGSLSVSSTDTHAKACPLRSAHCDSSVVFP